MRVYISLPISGLHLDRCKERANKVRALVEKRGHEAVTPFDVNPQPDMPYSYYMGRDIQTLMECDAIFLCTGWSNSKGCNLEWHCAQIFKKTIFTHISQLQTETDNETFS